MATQLGYEYNPAPQPGYGSFGQVPGPVSLPDPFGDLSNRLPQLNQINTQLGSNILDESQGKLSADTLAQLQNLAATYATKSGMPGSNAQLGSLANNQNLLANVLTSQQLKTQGLKDYASLVPTVSSTQTVSPQLQTNIAERNATMAAAPNPTDSASYARQLFDEYLNRMRGPAGGSGDWTSDPFFKSPSSGTRSRGPSGFPDSNPYVPQSSGGTTGDVPPQNTVYNPTGDSMQFDPFMGSEFNTYGNSQPSTSYEDMLYGGF